jgi:adenosylcobinamide kinase/adenosylcobinamide-phosphate guanylyltransferase
MHKSVVFVSGGARSGKTRYALARAESWPGSLLYIATAEIRDEEMRRRIERHRAERGARWETAETPLDPAGAVDGAAGRGAVLLDCLTLWTSNLLERHGEDDGAILAAADHLAAALRHAPAPVVVVTNEVGWGIVPENALARRFRDLAGSVNQRVAAAADEAVLVVSGLPLRVR